MLDKILREIPKLTEQVVRADVRGNGTYDVTKTGAADTGRAAARRTRTAAKRARTTAARKAPARATGAREQDLPIARYDSHNADEIVRRLPELSQADLARIEAYERSKENRTTVLERIASLRASEPWAGYDELNADEIQKRLAGADEPRAKAVREYERAHKARASVIEATERQAANA